MIREFIITEPKPSYAQWFIEVDLSVWLGSETIDSVDFKAKQISDGLDVSNVVLDATKSAFTGTVLKPFIRGGVSGRSYIAIMKVITNSVSVVTDEF